MWMFILPHERTRKFSERASRTGDSQQSPGSPPRRYRGVIILSFLPVAQPSRVCDVTSRKHALPRLWLPLQLLRERQVGWGEVLERRSDKQSQPHWAGSPLGRRVRAKSNLGYKRPADGAYSVPGVAFPNRCVCSHFQVTENVFHSVSGPLHLLPLLLGTLFSYILAWLAPPTTWFSVQSNLVPFSLNCPLACNPVWYAW